jgi:hypothetical protein
MRSATVFYKRLSELPVDSTQRLEHINHAATSAHHVLLAIKYGVTDGHIRALNKTIIGLLLSRLKAERSRNQYLIDRINETMLGLHLAIDWVTGVQPPYSAQHIERGACNRMPKRGRREH